MPFTGPQFIAQTSMVAGTPLTAAVLNALIVAPSFLVSGGILPTSGSLTATQPATQAVVNNGTSALWVSVTSGSLTLTASKDVYVDLDNAGAYHQVAVANGAAAPALTANSIRLYKAVTSGSAITSVVALAPSVPLPPSGIRQINPTVMSVDTTLAGATSFATCPNMAITPMVLALASSNLRFRLAGSIYNGDGTMAGDVVNWKVVVTKPDTTTATVYLHGSWMVTTAAGTTAHAAVSGENVLTGLGPGLYTFTLQYQSPSNIGAGVHAFTVPETDGLSLMIEEYL